MEPIRSSSREDERPNIRDVVEVFKGRVGIRSIALSGILLLVVFYTVYFARDFLLPVLLAFILSFLFAPAVRWLTRLHLPTMLGAGLIIALLLGIVGYGTYRLAAPAREWLEKAPRSFSTIRLKFRKLLEPVEKARQTTEQLEKMAALNKPNTVPTVELKKPGLGEFVFTGTQNFLVLFGVTIVLLYFLLASGDLFLLKLVRILPTLDDKKRAVEICRQVERDVSKYLWTVTLVNIGIGTAVGTAMYFLGMPNAALWGVMAGLLTYIPYLGPTLGILTVAAVSALTFDDPISIILPPAVYFILAVAEGNFITPFVLGRSLALNPVVIFIWLMFWGWAWGIPGAMVAVPLLAIVKIVCDHFNPLYAVSEFLAHEPKAVY
ncbi:MAG TPA: AI-2E family transporter [Candidatus Binatia bacterium]